MDPIYIVVITILLALAVSDLVVGVSNDAVNFLNSAIGSKVAPRWVIMTVASVGILFGAIFSSGMMEVARNGIFFPGQFDFHSMMMIFLAVMFTDVILLDTFNTLGLPTSTTVSLVFELLGAAVAVALVIMWGADGDTVGTLADYINSSKAMAIISGILLSVVISFTVGMIVMFISRSIFSFKYKKSFRYIGAIWCGVALTAISYFALFKGLKGSTLIDPSFKALIDGTSTLTLLLGSFAVWTSLMALLQFIFRLNILKLTVLAGTFALALAFAGNDLVNFIGVFMAGKSSFDIASEAAANGVDLSTLKMSALEQKVSVNFLYLLAAGAIMTVTLWFSKKARAVTETEINLSSQKSGDERFGSSLVSRALVRTAVNFNKGFIKVTPKPVLAWINKRFEPVEAIEDEKVDFDLIRATVNLSCAAILIAMATSLKLPLSTTYVTFMVAMGSSLADRAWGRDSAVYRITGVLTVISGWFLTAFVAFTVAFVVAMILMYGGDFAIYGMAVLCVYILIQSRIAFARKRKKQEALESEESVERGKILDEAATTISKTLDTISDLYDKTIEGIYKEDIKGLKKAVKTAKALRDDVKERKAALYGTLATLKQHEIHTGHYYVQEVDYLNEVAKTMLFITRPAYDYINNNHKGFSEAQISDLKKISAKSRELFHAKVELIRKGDTSVVITDEKRTEFFAMLDASVKHQIERVISDQAGSRSSMLYLSIINETKSMVLHTANLFKAHRSFVANNSETTEQ